MGYGWENSDNEPDQIDMMSADELRTELRAALINSEADKNKLAASRKTTHAYIERQDKVIDDLSDEIEELRSENINLRGRLGHTI